LRLEVEKPALFPVEGPEGIVTLLLLEPPQATRAARARTLMRERRILRMALYPPVERILCMRLNPGAGEKFCTRIDAWTAKWLSFLPSR
jgi:hypothetical protein